MDLVFDIETTAFDFEKLTESQQEFILRYAEKEKDEELREEKKDEAKRYLSLYPFTAKIIAIGMYNTESENTMVLYEGEEDEHTSEDGNTKYKGLSEPEMLNTFWECAKKVNKVVTFNGRTFDIPFVMMRSAINEIKPSVNFLTNRYDKSSHVDLLEQFTFYGLIKKFNLDFYCHAFGVDSPKQKGVTGMDVKELYTAGKIKEIAVYCGDDVKSTNQLYQIWKNYLDFQSKSRQ